MKLLFRERAQKGYPDEPLLAATQSKGVVRKEDYGARTVTATKDFHLLKLVEAGDFVISLRSFEGGIEVSHCRGIISPAYTVLAPRLEANQGYYSRFFKSADFIRSLTLFVTGIREGQNIDYERMSRAFMPLPPAEEQAAIGRFLDWANGRLERAIGAKRKVIALLNEQKQAIIHRAVTRGLDPSVPLKPSGIPWLGDIPGHWEVATIGAASTLIQTGPFGSQLHSHEYVAEGTPVINPSHIASGQLRASASVTIDEGKVRELSRHMLRSGDVVIARRGELGRCALVTPAEEGWICGTGSLLLRCRLSAVTPAFFQLVFSSRGMADMLSLFSIGATMANLNAGMVARQRLPVPPLDEQERIVRFVDTETHKVETAASRLDREIELLREYRTRLVADVVTGKLDVREAAARLPKEPEQSQQLDDVGLLAGCDDVVVESALDVVAEEFRA
jgi:type I restriction enzyme S subunit